MRICIWALRWTLNLVIGASALGLAATETRAAPRSSAAASLKPFNDAFTEATRGMDNAAVLALWAEDGVSLLPMTAPLTGKAKIGAFLKSIATDHPAARMEAFTNHCFDAAVSGDWASEWCLEHQIVSEPGKAKFDSWGKMLLVLHRDASGRWLLNREMWNQAAAPAGGS